MPAKTNGLGWTATLLDTLFSEYSWPAYTFHGQLRAGYQWIIWHEPLQRCFVFYAAIAARMDVEIKGPTYQQQAMVKAKRAVEARWEKGQGSGASF
jgi:hypothetical protein